MLNNYLSYRLATHMGLISPHAEVVNVALNGENLGVFILTEQLEESTIRRHGRMPGDVYSGELVGRDSYQGIENMLFDHPGGVWTKAAINNHFAEEALEPLERLVRVIEDVHGRGGPARPHGPRRPRGLRALLRLRVARLLRPHDALHNWRLYYDPWETRFVPIVWDPVGWHRWPCSGAARESPRIAPT